MTLFQTTLLCGLFLSSVAVAETTLEQQLSIELNAAQPSETGCTLSFLITNAHDASVEKAVYEAVLFDQNQQVNRMMLFDFGALPAKRPRVRQFMVPNLSCANLSMVLINGANQCDGADLPVNACLNDLKLGSRTPIKVQG